MGRDVLLLSKDFRGNESRGLARKAAGNHVGSSPVHLQISQYLLSTYSVPSPGDIIINRYGICLHRAYRDGRKARAFPLNKVSCPLNQADPEGYGTHRAASPATSPPQNKPKTQRELGAKAGIERGPL